MGRPKNKIEETPEFQAELGASLAKIKSSLDEGIKKAVQAGQSDEYPEWAPKVELEAHIASYEPGKAGETILDKVEALPDPELPGKRPRSSYRPSAKRIFPLLSKDYREMQKLQGAGKWNQAKVAAARHEAKIQNATAKTWSIKGRPVNRFQMMLHVVEELSRGELLSDLALRDGYPSVSTMISWKEEHPDFRTALDLAKKAQAQVFADKALRIVLDEDVHQRASLAKNKHDALMKRAALQNPDFRESAQEAKDKPVDLSPGDIKSMQDQLLMMLQADSSLLPPAVQQAIKEAIEGKPAGLTLTLIPEQDGEG